MAKKDKKAGKKDKGAPDPAVVVDAVRERGRGLLDEVTSAAQRIRESFDDIRVLEDVRALRAEVDSLARRLAALEQKPGAAKPAARSTAAKSTAAKSTARKPASARSSARKPASAKPTPKPRTTTRTRSSSSATTASGGGAGRRPAAAKRSTAARKPAGS